MVLLSLLIVLLLGNFFGKIASSVKIPSLVGMIVCGVIIGSYGLNILDTSFYDISYLIRMFSLTIILIRAGLSLNVSDFKTMGTKAILMSFLPTLFEMLGCIIFSTYVLHFDSLQALLLATILASSSPAVTIPRMIRLIDEGYGGQKAIPKMILASDAIDDVINLVLFSSFLNLNVGETVSLNIVASVPLTIILSIALGLLVGLIIYKVSSKLDTTGTFLMLLIIGGGFALAEEIINLYIPISSLIITIMMTIPLTDSTTLNLETLKLRFNKLWSFFQIFLFVWVGTQLNLSTTLSYVFPALWLFLALIFSRTLGVFVTLSKSNLNFKERTFVAFCGIPKATVQASIGLIPASLGVINGDVIASLSTLSILFSAPLGAILLDTFSHKLLNKE